MDLQASFFHIIENIGFRNMLTIFGATGLLLLIWLSFSLPGGLLFKNLVRLFLLAGIVLLVLILPLHMRVIMPTIFIRIICFTISVTVFLILLQIIRSALLFPGLVLYPVWKLPFHLLLSRALSLLVLVAGLGLGSLAFWNTIRIPDIREVRIPVANLPPALENYHIVQITDTHLGTIFDEDWCRAVVERANSVQPDLIALTGDIGEFGPDAITSALEPLRELRAEQGVYFALGNHENYQDLPQWTAWYENAGTLLRNSHRLLSKGDAQLAIIGLDNSNPDMDRATRNIPSRAIGVVLAHRPALAPMVSTYNVQLQLSGHTHGGLLPVLRAMVAKANKNFVSGLYQVSHMWLYVSNGTGLWTYMALRLDTPAEITSIRLVRAQ